MTDIVIVNGARTAMGGFQGSLASVTAPELGAVTIKEAIARAGLQPTDIEEVILGCVLPAGLKQVSRTSSDASSWSSRFYWRGDHQ